jgi:Zn-dependent protease
VSGAPLKISWFLVIFFVYQLIDAANATGAPIWLRVLQVVVSEFLLLLTVLCHEMGHGTMARRKGGEIAEVLLWPFGGICFTTRAQGRGPREKLVDDLWIVGAGPATHFPMAAVWLLLVSAMVGICSDVHFPTASWRYLIPFANNPGPCPPRAFPVQHGPDICFTTYTGYLLHHFFVQAVQLNVLLFIFNVFFPMYPMDGAKLIVCSLQLFCGASARFAAKVLIYTSAPLAVFFIGRSLWGLNGGGMQPGLQAFMGFMCLAEAYKIWRLMKEERLYTHPLFELARSNTREVGDSMGASMRLNHAERDDPEVSRRGAPTVQFTEIRPFAGSGRALATGATVTSEGAQLPVVGGDRSDPEAGVGGAGPAVDRQRQAWLDKMDREAKQKAKSVRELEDERLERLELERLNAR